MRICLVVLSLLMTALSSPGAAAEPAASSGAPPTSAAPSRPPSSAAAEAAAYERCMTMARQNPAAGREMAQGWQARGGAHPADHCFAVALIGLKQYKEAAARLEKLAGDMVHAPAELRAEVLGQAAQAWLLAGEAGRAYGADTRALGLLPGDPDLLVDRAEAAGTAGWYDKSLADLDQVLKASPSRLDALIYRASAYRELRRLEPALADVETALKEAPDSVAALLERGNIRSARGDLDGARQDWTRVTKLAPDSAAAAAAKDNIAKLAAMQANPPATPENRR